MDKLLNSHDDIRDRIFELLKESNISQKDFADMLNISSQTVTDWKKGKSNSFSGKLGPISDILHTTPIWLFSGEGEKYVLDVSKKAKTAQQLNDLYRGIIEAQDETIASAVQVMNRLSDMAQQCGGRIPVLGDVAAGIPIEAITDIVDYEEIDAALAATGEFFGLRVKGDSMEPRMMEGDVVIVRKQDSAETGDTVVVLVNGDSATVKKIKYGPDGISLIPTNPVHDVQFYSAADVERLPVRVIGRVVELRAQY